jgi:CDP-6-deoxy-D-xylo-4-hexulose-3-dehydrase
MAVTDDDGLADLLRAMRAHGWVRQMKSQNEKARQHPDIDPRFLFVTTGFNLRPTEINAAIGIEQLKRIEGFNETRRRVAARLDEGLARLKQSGELTLIRHHPGVRAAPFGYTVLCASREARNGLQRHLEAADIETRPVIAGNLTRQPALDHFHYRISGDLSGADRVMDCGVYWGTHPVMDDVEVEYIINTVN